MSFYQPHCLESSQPLQETLVLEVPGGRFCTWGSLWLTGLFAARLCASCCGGCKRKLCVIQAPKEGAHLGNKKEASLPTPSW